ncbi:MAG: hypothetical protein O3B95_02380 [Chloroflexi bacterium]|nr:hypothetical protein [Chloroflexota bacterium]
MHAQLDIHVPHGRYGPASHSHRHGCTAEPTDDRSIDPLAPTVDQIIERTRAAMNEFTSYRIRGASLERQSKTAELSLAYRSFSERESRDRYRSLTDIDPDAGGYLLEFVVLGPRMFRNDGRETYSGWQESEPIYDRGERESAFDIILSTLDSAYAESVDKNEIQLVSTDEVTDDGIRVYRLESVNNFRHSWNRDGVFEVRTTSLLIDQETYRLVARTVDKHSQNGWLAGSSLKMPADVDGWQWLFTERYYDYDVPIVVKVPDEYEPWSGTAMVLE